MKSGAAGLGWNVTAGPDMLSRHGPVDMWGWNARAASSKYLAVEIAQATVAQAISDATVRAIAWWIRNDVLPWWPDIPLYFPTHAELPEGIADGKSDVFPRGDSRADELRGRIKALL